MWWVYTKATDTGKNNTKSSCNTTHLEEVHPLPFFLRCLILSFDKERWSHKCVQLDQTVCGMLSMLGAGDKVYAVLCHEQDQVKVAISFKGISSLKTLFFCSYTSRFRNWTTDVVLFSGSKSLICFSMHVIIFELCGQYW